VVAALSLATDVAMGQPLESGLEVCRVALGLADEAGLDGADRARVYHVALLRHSGCTAENAVFGAIVGDDIAFRAGAATIDASARGARWTRGWPGCSPRTPPSCWRRRTGRCGTRWSRPGPRWPRGSSTRRWAPWRSSRT
jgi:hypothetical protein